MSSAASDLSEGWERFYQHCEFTFGGPLSKYTKEEKICNLKSCKLEQEKKGKTSTKKTYSKESLKDSKHTSKPRRTR